MASDANMVDLLSALEAIETDQPISKVRAESSGQQLDCNGKPIVQEKDIFYEQEQLAQRKAVKHTRDIMSVLYELDDTPIRPDVTIPPQQINENYYDDYVEEFVEEYDADGNFIAPVQSTKIVPDRYLQEMHQPAPKVQYSNKLEWLLVENKHDSLPNIKTYSVVNSIDSKAIFSDILLRESAMAIQQSLNNGESLNSVKLLGVISSGLQYTEIMQEAVSLMKERTKVLNECNYERARELDSLILEKRMETDKMKKSVLKFISSSLLKG